MRAYYQIEEVSLAPQFGNTGDEGWGFTLWSELLDDDAPHRQLLERLVEHYPFANLTLPKWTEAEDLIEGALVWEGKTVWVWFETILSHLWLWSADRSTVVSLRRALVSLIDTQGGQSS